MNCFAVMDGLPVYEVRAKISNVNVNDIITYKVNGFWIFSVVIGTTPTLMKVHDLIYENTENGINLYISYKQNSVTKCLLKESRKMFKIKNVQLLATHNYIKLPYFN